MKIAYLSFSRIPSRKANAVQVMRMCEAFARLGHQVTLFARPGDEASGDVYQHYGVARNFVIVWCRRPSIAGLGGAIYGWRVAQAVKTHPLPELFYGRDLYSFVAAASLGRPMVFESHVLPTGIGGRMLQQWLFARKNFKRLVVISQALEQGYRRLFSWLPKECLFVAPSAAAVPQSSSTENAVLAAGRLRSSSRPQVGYVGQLYRGKGVELILELARRMPEIDFHLVGGTDELVASWRSASQGMRNVQFHGHVAPAKTEQFRQAMDVLLAPYQESVLTESGSRDIAQWMSPLKIVEYMRSRKPIVASDLPAIREMLAHEVNALLVPPADADAWARAVKQLVEDAALRERLSAQAFTDSQNRFDMQARACAVLAGVCS